MRENHFCTKRYVKILTTLLCITILFPLVSCTRKQRVKEENHRENRQIETKNKEPLPTETKEEMQGLVGNINTNVPVVSADVPYYLSRELNFYEPSEEEYITTLGVDANEENIAVLLDIYEPLPEDEDTVLSFDNDEDIDLHFSQYNKYELFILDRSGKLKTQIHLKDIIEEDFAHFDYMKFSGKNELTFIFSSMNYFKSENSFLLYQLDIQGNILIDGQIFEIEASDKSENAFLYINDGFIDQQGYLYFIYSIYDINYEVVENVLSVYSPDIEKLFSIEDNLNNAEDEWMDFQFFSDGKNVYLSIEAYSEYMRSGLYLIDLQKKSLGERLDMQEMNIEINDEFFSGQSGLYHANDSSLSQIDLEKMENRTLFNWSDIDFEPTDSYVEDSYRRIYPLSEELIFVTTEPYIFDDDSYTHTHKSYMLEKTKNPNIGKKIIRIGGYNITGDNMLKNAIYHFNQNNSEYRAEIVDYAQNLVYKGDYEKWQEDYQQVLTEMDINILTGDAPDILFGDSEFFSHYVSEGILTDLNTFIDADPDFKQEDFFENILHFHSYDDKLFQISPSFALYGLVGAKSTVGERDAWTLEEFKEFATYLSPDMKLLPSIDIENLLEILLSVSGQNIINLETSEINFDSQTFRDILTFTKDYGDDDYYNNYSYDYDMEDEIALTDMFVTSPRDYLTLELAFGEPASFIGFPSTDKSGIICHTQNSLMIVDRSPLKDEAWVFAKAFFSKESQEKILNADYSIPVRRDVLDEELEKLIAMPDDIRNLQYQHYDLDEDVAIPEMTREKADDFISFIERVDSLTSFDYDIIELIMEESYLFFSDIKSLDRVISALQKKEQELLAMLDEKSSFGFQT